MFLSFGLLEINFLNPCCMPGPELQMEIQPHACSQGLQGRRGLAGWGTGYGWREKVEPSTGEEGAERRDGCVAEKTGALEMGI